MRHNRLQSRQVTLWALPGRPGPGMGRLMDDRASSVASAPGSWTQMTRSAPGTRGSLLRVSRPAERQPDPDLGRSPGGDQIDPGGAAVQRGHDLKPQDDLAVVPRWHPAVAAGGVPAAAAVAYP